MRACIDVNSGAFTKECSSLFSKVESKSGFAGGWDIGMFSLLFQGFFFLPRCYTFVTNFPRPLRRSHDAVVVQVAFYFRAVKNYSNKF